MVHDQQRFQTIRVLREMLQDLNVAMLTTQQPDGSLRSRPMKTLPLEYDGNIYFLTDAGSRKVDAIREHQQVNLSYSEPGDQHYVSIMGSATVVRDARQLERVWQDEYAHWLPDDCTWEDLVLIRVRIEKAEYWDVKTGRMQSLPNLFRAIFQPGSDQASPPHQRAKLPSVGLTSELLTPLQPRTEAN